MKSPNPLMAELRDKLVKLEYGDIDLVNKALWYAAEYKRE